MVPGLVVLLLVGGTHVPTRDCGSRGLIMSSSCSRCRCPLRE